MWSSLCKFWGVIFLLFQKRYMDLWIYGTRENILFRMILICVSCLRVKLRLFAILHSDWLHTISLPRVTPSTPHWGIFWHCATECPYLLQTISRNVWNDELNNRGAQRILHPPPPPLMLTISLEWVFREIFYQVAFCQNRGFFYSNIWYLHPYIM